MKPLLLRIVNRLYFVLAGIEFPSTAGLWADGWNFGSTLAEYLLGMALCVLGGRVLRREGTREMAASLICLLLPMVLLALLGQRSQVDCLVNLLLAVLSMWIGYKGKR